MRSLFKDMLDSVMGRERVSYLILPQERHTLSVDVTETSKTSFEALAAHMGVSHEEAMLEALNDWHARNAEIYDFSPVTTEETN